MRQVKLLLRKVPTTREWVVQWLENGKLNEERSYYTSSYQDALDTAGAMADEALALGADGVVVKQIGRGSYRVSDQTI